MKIVAACLAAIALLMLALAPEGSALGASPAPLQAPTPSTASTTPIGAIGILERNRATKPSALAKYVGDADPEIASRAILAIGRLKNPDGATMLQRVLSDPRRPDLVRATAAFALGVIGSPDSSDSLVEATRHDSPPIVAMAANALGRIGGSASIDALTPLLRHADSDVRQQAALSLGEAGLSGAPYIDMAHRTLAADAIGSGIVVERDQEVRWREAWALGRAYYQAEPSLLRRLLTDDEELVRLYAASGLGRLADRSYALPVRLIANDPSWRVRVEVRNALVKMHDPTKVNLAPPSVPASDLAEPKPLPSGAPFGDHPQVAVVTNKGVIVLEMFPDVAPYSVDNFLTLVDRGFYNNLSYFRVIEDFVVQGGDPQNTGDGGPGYSIPGELNSVQQLTGIISYGLDYDPKANVPRVDTAGSQYYITQSPQLHLDRGFTVFGRVVKGLAVVDAIAPHSIGQTSTADVAKRVYRCEPVTAQTDDVEAKLRSAEIGYDAR